MTHTLRSDQQSAASTFQLVGTGQTAAGFGRQFTRRVQTARDTRGSFGTVAGFGTSATSEHPTHMVASYQYRIEVLEREVAELRSLLGVDRPAPRVLPVAEARTLIKGYFVQHHGSVFFPDDVAEALNLDIGQTIEICRALASEGSLAEKSDQ